MFLTFALDLNYDKIKNAVDTVVVPSSVKRFPMSKAYNYKTIIYSGTMDEWKSIAYKIGVMDHLTYDFNVICSDGTVNY